VKNKICCIFNYAPHYRQAVYELMDKELNCDFYFGSKLQTAIRKIDYRRLSNTRELKSVWFLSKAYWMCSLISLLFKSYRIYVLTGQINCINNWIMLPLAKILGKDIYLWNHGWYGKESRWKKWLKKIYYRPVNGFFLYGEYARNLMIAEGFNPKKLHVVFNSLNYEQSVAIRKRIKKSDIYKNRFPFHGPVIVFSGRLQPVKKLDMLLEVLKKQKQRGIIYNLTIIGDGPDKDRLQKLTIEYSIQNQVWFCGSCYDESILSELIFNADLCVSPGNVGLTAIHALSYGTPVITHDDFAHQMPEFEAIQPGITGSFFEKDNINSLILEIENWLILHPEKDSDLISACYRVVDEKYNPFYQVEVIKNILSCNL
jgi:glycosyltransferase involved in cell wall biosynthesis